MKLLVVIDSIQNEHYKIIFYHSLPFRCSCNVASQLIMMAVSGYSTYLQLYVVQPHTVFYT